MIVQPTYQAAQAVAPKVEAHFAHHFNLADPTGAQKQSHRPSVSVIEAIIDTTFWASLRREEGYSPKISLAFLSPEQAGQPMVFANRLPLVPTILTKLAPAVERPGIHLGVWCEDDELFIWGTTREIPANCFVLEVIEPGLLVVKHRRPDGFGKFINVAILKGDQVKIVDEHTAGLPDCPSLLTSMLSFSLPSSWHDSMNVLVQLAVSMRAHGRGGSLLVVPAHSQTWRESIIQPMSYPVVPVFNQLADLMRLDPIAMNQSSWKSNLSLAVDSIAGLTAVDGATIISDQYELLGFGAKIGRSDKSTRIEQIIVTEPIVDNVAVVVHPTQNGGTRHLSAAQFVYDQRDAMALIASQDGRFTLFTWSACEGMVHAHRVDSLLL